MASVEGAWEQVFAGLAALRGAWPSQEWGYDRRFQSVMSTITTADKQRARAACDSLFKSVFDSAAIVGAPPGPRALADQYGGVRSGQLLLWNGEAGKPGAFGLWWPWGDGQSVSLRVGLHDVDLPKTRYPKLRDVFSVPQAPPGHGWSERSHS
ncbi:MAG TPA: hypothetical protein VMU50_14260 [Polyangia bacterium]|nr:hypothetical protein [Polyangia bacterium]